MTLKQLVGLSVNYNKIKFWKETPYVIENRDLEKILVLELTERLSEIKLDRENLTLTLN